LFAKNGIFLLVFLSSLQKAVLQNHYFCDMSKAIFETKSLVIIAMSGFTINFILGIVGFMLPEISYQQLLFYQIADAAAITASVIAARYTGLRGEHVAASAFILMGITHGLSLASSGLEEFNIEKGITVIMPMVPSMILLSWCSMFPTWVRIGAVVPVSLFTYVYLNVISGGTYYDRPLRLAYLSWMILEILWAVYMLRDWKREKAKA
jgi:hypothetical protein